MKIETRVDQISSAGLSAIDFRSKQNGLNDLKGNKNIIFTIVRRRFMAAKHSYHGPVYGLLVFWLQIAIEPLSFFFSFFVFTYVSLQCFTDEVEYLYVSDLEVHQK